MSTAHSPSPWTADDGGSDWIGIFGADGDAIAFLVTPGAGRLVPPQPLREPAERLANARLLAAAPELLAACEALESAIEQITLLKFEGDYAALAAAQANALRAIAKARGGAA
jgi:hypothetical protein